MTDTVSSVREKLDPYFRTAGLNAVLPHEKARLWATVNPLGNFTVAVAQIIDDAIVKAWNTNRDDHCQWANDYVKRGPRRSDLKGEAVPSFQNEFVVAVAKDAYAILQAPDPRGPLFVPALEHQ